MRKLSIGRAVWVGLLGVTLLLGALSAFAVAGIFDARQDYEDKLADSYDLQVSAGRLLTAGVLEAAVFERRGQRAARARQLAQEAFDEEARTAAELAASDPKSAEIVERRIAAQERAREAAQSGESAPDAPDPLGSALLTARELSSDLSARQEARREEARDEADDDTRASVIAAAVLGLAPSLGVVALITLMVASMRRPLDELVGATGRLAGGDLDSRVEPAGPRELRDLAESFNTMAGELDAAHRRLIEERQRLAMTIESLGDALVVCDPDGTVASVNPRARELVPALEPGGPSQGPASPAAAARGRARRRGDRRQRRSGRSPSPPPRWRARGVVWTLRDITERARLERLKTEFVATASHELRSPLTSIKGFVELLSRSRRARPTAARVRRHDPALDRTGSSTSSTTCSTSRGSRPGQFEIHRAADRPGRGRARGRDADGAADRRQAPAARARPAARPAARARRPGARAPDRSPTC